MRLGKRAALRYRAATRAAAIALGYWCHGLTVPARADATWSTPRTLVSSRVWQYDPAQIAANAAGDAVIAWHREEDEAQNGIEATTGSPGVGWTAPVVLEASPGTTGLPVQAGIDPLGDATVIWISSLISGEGEVRASRIHAGTTWEHPSTVANVEPGFQTPKIAIGRSGAVTVASSTYAFARRATRSILQLSHRRRAGAWSRTRIAYSSTQAFLEEPQLAVDDAGETILCWVARAEHQAWVQALVFGRNGRPRGRVQTLSPKGGHSAGLQLASNARGDAVLAWRQFGANSQDVEVATRAPGERFSSRTTVSRGNDTQPTAAVEMGGSMAVLFTHVISRHPYASVVDQSASSNGRNWNRPTPVAPASAGSSFAPHLASNPEGNELLAVWSVERSTHPQRFINASFSTSAGVWTPPEALAQVPEGLGASAAFTSGGHAIAVWNTADVATRFESIQTAEYAP